MRRTRPAMPPDEITRAHLHYPLEKVGSAVTTLATHPGKVRERVNAVRHHLAGLGRLQLHESAKAKIRTIHDLLARAAKNKSGNIAPRTAQRVAQLVVDLDDDLRTKYDDLGR